MAWTTIARVGAAPKNPCPPKGVAVSVRKMASRSGTDSSYIQIIIAADLAAEAGYHLDEQGVRLMIGSDNDAGKICVALDQAGGFVARGKPGKPYKIAIGRLSATGLFSMDFTAFTRAPVEVVKPANGQPKHFAFLATGEMLDLAR